MRPSFSGLLDSFTTNAQRMNPPAIFQAIQDKVVVDSTDRGLCVESTTPQTPNTLRLVCVSDTHTAHGVVPLPPGDILVHAGDFTDVGQEKDIDAFCSWLSDQKQFKHKIVIAGNHDLSLDKPSYVSRNAKRFGHSPVLDVAEQEAKLRSVCTFLTHSTVDIEGVRFFGSPYTPEFYDWGFNLSRVNECHDKWESIPTNVDVLLTHGPPLGHGDVCVGSGHQGCADLLDWIEKNEPKCHIFGHIHEGYGVTTNGKGRTTFVNASSLDYNYDVTKPNPPLVVDIPKPSSASEAPADEE